MIIQDICTLAESGRKELQRMASDLYNILVHVMKGEACMVVRGLAMRTASRQRGESTRTHPSMPAKPLT